jgi:hypothetical protein
MDSLEEAHDFINILKLKNSLYKMIDLIGYKATKDYILAFIQEYQEKNKQHKSTSTIVNIMLEQIKRLKKKVNHT